MNTETMLSYSTGTTPDPHRSELGPRTAPLIAGLSYLAIFALAVFANFAVLMRVKVPGDATATTANLAASPGMVRLAVAAFLIVFLLDVAVSWALYVILRPAGVRTSLLAAWFRLTYTVFLGVGLTFLHLSVGLAESGRSEATLLALDAFDITWLIGLSAFGVHLVLVGGLLVTSRMAPRALGAVLVVAGLAYVVDTFAHVLLADYAAVADAFLVMVAVPSVLGELGLTVWLLSRARRPRRVPSAALS